MAEACRLLQEAGGRAKPLAGGTDLLVQLRKRTLRVEALVDLKRIGSLRGIDYQEGRGLRIGPLTTHSELLENPYVREHYPILAQAAQTIGSVQIRNKGTVGGNLCHAVPSADLAPPLLVLGAEVILRGNQGRRRLPLDQFFLGPNQTVLREDELLEEILVPPVPAGSAGVYLKHGIRRAMEIAIAGVAVAITPGGDGEGRQQVRIALGAVAPVPMRAQEAEDYLQEEGMGTEQIQQAASLAANQARPISDLRGSAEYRRHMVRVLTARALQNALQMVTATQED